MISSALGYPVINNFHLAAPDSCTYIAHSIVVTQIGMLVMRCVIARLCGKKYGFLFILFFLNNQSTPTGSSDNFISIETQYGNISEGPTFFSFKSNAQSFRSIFNYRNFISRSEEHTYELQSRENIVCRII